jgi:AraC-like DNA-binding protein
VFRTGRLDPASSAISGSTRTRRTDEVAFSLHTSARRLPSADLAPNHGTAGTEAMIRAFRDRFGTSPSEYRAGGHRTLG